jgi:hypothetical protein
MAAAAWLLLANTTSVTSHDIMRCDVWCCSKALSPSLVLSLSCAYS